MQHGGELVYQGTIKEINGNTQSHTTNYLSKKEEIKVPALRRKWKDAIVVSGARENN